MNKFDIIISNLNQLKNDLYGFNRELPHKYVAIRLVKYIYSELILLNILEQWRRILISDIERKNQFYSYFHSKIKETQLIPLELENKFDEYWGKITDDRSFLFPERLVTFAEGNQIGKYLDQPSLLREISNPANFPENRTDILECYKGALIDFVEQDPYLVEELRWLVTSLNHDKNNYVSIAKMIDIYDYFSDPLLVVQRNIHLNSDDFREGSLGIIDTLIYELQSKSFMNYWIERYCQRAHNFNKLFYKELQITQNLSQSMEDNYCQHFMLYLYDNKIDLTYNQHKEGFRPDIELTKSVIEVKLFREGDTISRIRSELIKAIREVNLQSNAHPSTDKYVLIYNESERFLLNDSNYRNITFKTIDLGIGIRNDVPSHSTREILEIEQLLEGD